MKCAMGEKTVYTKQDLNDAVNRHQERIVIKGKLAKKVYKDMNGGTVVKKTTGIALGIGTWIFTPLAVPAMVLLLGKSYHNYNMIRYTENEVVIELKEKIQNKAKWV